MEHKNQDHMPECQVSESHTSESHTLESHTPETHIPGSHASGDHTSEKHTPETHTAAADTADMVAATDTADAADRSGTATTADKSVTGSKRPKDKIQLSDHFDYKRLFRFVLPSVAMMIFTSIYSVVDGFFVSNFVGKVPFAAVNFTMPVLMLLSSVGFIFGTGGNALVSKTMGEGDYERSNRLFSMLIYIAAGVGAALAVVGIIFLPQIISKLGAEGEMLDNCVLYGRIILAAQPAFVLQYAFQSFFVTAGKPGLGFVATVGAGLMNMVLDAVFIIAFGWGIAGAAAATAASGLTGALIPLIYFARKNSSLLKLTKTSYDGKALLKTCTNGASEFVTSIAMSVVSMLYNLQLMKYAGADGVAAYGVLMYVNYIFIAVFIGYSVGTAPLFGYNYGAQNHSELHNLFRRSLWVINVCGVVMFALIQLLAGKCAAVFVGYDPELVKMTTEAFHIYCCSFLFVGMSIFGSAFFTALNNGLISAIISFMRTLVFEVGAVLILPLIFGIQGIWGSVVVAEVVSAALTIGFMIAKRSKYHY